MSFSPRVHTHVHTRTHAHTHRRYSNPIPELKRLAHTLGLCYTPALLRRVAAHNTQAFYGKTQRNTAKNVPMTREDETDDRSRDQLHGFAQDLSSAALAACTRSMALGLQPALQQRWLGSVGAADRDADSTRGPCVCLRARASVRPPVRASAFCAVAARERCVCCCRRLGSCRCLCGLLAAAIDGSHGSSRTRTAVFFFAPRLRAPRAAAVAATTTTIPQPALLTRQRPLPRASCFVALDSPGSFLATRRPHQNTNANDNDDGGGGGGGRGGDRRRRRRRQHRPTTPLPQQRYPTPHLDALRECCGPTHPERIPSNSNRWYLGACATGAAAEEAAAIMAMEHRPHANVCFL